MGTHPDEDRRTTGPLPPARAEKKDAPPFVTNTPRPGETAEQIAARTAPRNKQRMLEGTSEERKTFPITTGVMDYFPDAVAEVSKISYWGNEKHNPGEPMHHARGKSSDHADCIARHLVERGGFDTIVVNGQTVKLRHSAALAWRALALLQEEVEREMGLDKPRGATELPRR